MRLQKFVSQPTELGHVLPYCVARRNPDGNGYTPLKGEEYPTKKDADERAAELNKENEEDSKEFDNKE